MKENDRLVLKYIGNRFKEFREEVGYSRRDAADLIGITMRTLASYERGEREVSMDTTIKMAAAYKTTFTMLTDHKNVYNDFDADMYILSRTGEYANDGKRLQEYTI